MTRQDILSTITEILGEVLERDGLVLTEATRAEDVPDWDSVNHVRLLMGLEAAYGIEFGTDETGGVRNVGELIDLIQRKR